MEIVNFSSVIKSFPNEWVLIGNPTIKDNLVVDGVLIEHDKDKKKLAEKVKTLQENFELTVLRFTGNISSKGKWLKFTPYN